ncbi:uncharacterized protein DS421_9g257570 [Arachis hypogaea]|nr:uncharacterized protein DS421_9g257570 [Arachis hypogaea]
MFLIQNKGAVSKTKIQTHSKKHKKNTTFRNLNPKFNSIEIYSSFHRKSNPLSSLLSLLSSLFLFLSSQSLNKEERKNRKFLGLGLVKNKKYVTKFKQVFELQQKRILHPVRTSSKVNFLI